MYLVLVLMACPHLLTNLMCTSATRSAHQTELMRQGSTKFLCTGDVYRRDEIDASCVPLLCHEAVKACVRVDHCVNAELPRNHATKKDNNNKIKTQFYLCCPILGMQLLDLKHHQTCPADMQLLVLNHFQPCATYTPGHFCLKAALLPQALPCFPSDGGSQDPQRVHWHGES